MDSWLIQAFKAPECDGIFPALLRLGLELQRSLTEDCCWDSTYVNRQHNLLGMLQGIGTSLGLKPEFGLQPLIDFCGIFMKPRMDQRITQLGIGKLQAFALRSITMGLRTTPVVAVGALL